MLPTASLPLHKTGSSNNSIRFYYPMIMTIMLVVAEEIHLLAIHKTAVYASLI